MNFNSHTDAMVGIAAELVNAVTPGMRHGRRYAVPAGEDLGRAVNDSLGPGARRVSRLDHPTTRRLAAQAVRLRQVFELVDDGDLDTAARTVNALLEELQPTPYLERHDGEPWHLHFHGRSHDLAESWAASCAIALATVLGGEYATRLGVCSASECDRVYVDVSRNGTRRFCSTACQNRVKAAAHRARVSA